jgi:hypothetical protein
VLNITIQSILEKKRCEGKEPQRNTQNLNALNKVIKTNGNKNLEGEQVAHLWG